MFLEQLGPYIAVFSNIYDDTGRVLFVVLAPKIHHTIKNRNILFPMLFLSKYGMFANRLMLIQYEPFQVAAQRSNARQCETLPTAVLTIL